MLRWGAVAFMVAYVILATQLAALEHFVPRAQLSTWDVRVPKSCMSSVMRWTNGHSLSNMPIEEFLRIKRQVEGCGGEVKLETKQDSN